jgi:hypothetical protein
MKRIYFEKVKPSAVRLWLEDEHICYLRFPSVTNTSDMNRAHYVHFSRIFWFSESGSEMIQTGWRLSCADKGKEVWLQLGIFPTHHDTPLTIRVCKTDRANAAHDEQSYTDLSLILERLFKDAEKVASGCSNITVKEVKHILIHRK